MKRLETIAIGITGFFTILVIIAVTVIAFFKYSWKWCRETCRPKRRVSIIEEDPYFFQSVYEDNEGTPLRPAESATN